MTKNNFILSDAEKRDLIKLLEKLYANRLFNRDFYNRVTASRVRKTEAQNTDRDFRTDIKSCEILLYKLGSDLFKDVEQTPSIRRTTELTARDYRAIQSKRSFMDN
jgi:hypothetical protein